MNYKRIAHGILTLSCWAALCQVGCAVAQSIDTNPNQRWHCHAHKDQWVCQAIYSGTELYEPGLTTQQHQQALVDNLGWVEDTSDTPKENCSTCGGHYVEPTFADTGKLQSLSQAPAQGTYGHATYLVNGTVQLQGPIDISQPDRTLFIRNHATLYPNLTTGQLEKISAQGDVRLHQPGQLFLGKDGQADLFNHQAELNDVTYLVKVKSDWRHSQTSVNDNTDQNFTGYAHGHASKVVQLDQNVFQLYDTTYSTCPPTSNTWDMYASKITLDRLSGEGVTRNTLLRIHGMPVFYSPYFSFPLNDQRKTGFLYGTMGTSGSSGFFVNTPFYLNLAPNYDDTITPTFYTKRGVLWDNQFRYLNTWFNGELNTQYLPYDEIRDMSNRYEINTDDTAYLSQNWQANVDYNKVGDDNFISDIEGDSNAIIANQVLLNQQFTLSYSNLHWQFTGLMQQYQIINDQLDLDNQPYRRLPELDLSSQYPDLLSPFALSFSSQLVNFQKDVFQGETPIEGDRANIAPTVSLPLVKPYGFFTPSITASATNYNLNNTSVSSGFPESSIQRTLPIIDVDSGLYFDRNFTFGQDSYTQTLEPRLFYLWVPYRDQNNIPIFDTTMQNFTYQSLFDTNRFSGIDRIGDANQVSYSLSTSINNALGQPLFSAGAGQIIYLQNRQVTLCQQNASNPNCVAWVNNDINTSRTSDYAGYAVYNINADWNVNTNVAFNPDISEFDSQSYMLQYQPDARHVFNIGYQNNQNDYALMSTEDLIAGDTPPLVSQLTTSMAWGLTNNWSLLGEFNYAFNASRVVDEFGGFQYSACCWAVQFIYRRFVNDSDPNNPASLTGPYTTATMIQFQLKGLAGTSNEQIETLEQAIPGYNPNQSGFN